MPQLKRTGPKRKPRTRKVPVPEWGEKDTYVYVRALSVSAANAVDGITRDINDGKTTAIEGAAAICVHGICDAEGRLIYDDPSDFSDMEVAPLLRCMDAMLDLSGLTEEADKATVKNSKRQRDSSRSS